MAQRPVPNTTDVSTALLDIVPNLLRRLRADVPVDEQQAADAGPGWREIVELRATPGQLSLLRVLVEHDRCTMQELAEHLAVAPSTATAMVKRLLEQKYIERNRDATNWRTVWVAPTEAGRQAVTIFHQARLQSLRHRLEQLSEDEQNAIQAALQALRHLVEVLP